MSSAEKLSNAFGNTRACRMVIGAGSLKESASTEGLDMPESERDQHGSM